MDLKLANDVVYAILATVGFIFLVVYTARIVKLRAERPKPMAGVPEHTAPWPAVTQETQK